MTLDIFKYLFTQEVLNFQKLKSYITSELEKWDFAIAEFLSYETPEVFWLVRKLNEEYLKAFPAERTAQESFLNNNFIDNLVRSCAYNLHKTGVSDHRTNNTKDIILNIIETALPYNEPENVISLQDNEKISSQMDTLNDDDISTDTNNIQHVNLPSFSLTSNTQYSSSTNQTKITNKNQNKPDNK